MPELPEVQTTVDQLARRIRNRRIQTAWMDPVKTVHTGSNLPWPTIKRYIIGKTIKEVTRRAKFIVINLDGGAKLWVHQKMTGHLLVGQWKHTKTGWISTTAGPLQNDPTNRYIRTLIGLDRNLQIGLSDARRFARIILTKSDADIPKVRELANLGPEPLDLSSQEFSRLLKSKRGYIKPVLMNPAIIVGIGNIYADEILHRAGIHPLSRVEHLDQATLTTIHRHMRSILKAAIKAGGSSTHDYRTPEGGKGGYQFKHRAYQRTGQLCTSCKAGTIERIVHAGRSSHFCSHHQLCA